MKSAKQTSRKLFTLTMEEIAWIKNYQHENRLSSENAVIKALIKDKMNHKKEVIDSFFADQKNRVILTKLADK